MYRKAMSMGEICLIMSVFPSTEVAKFTTFTPGHMGIFAICTFYIEIVRKHERRKLGFIPEI